MIEEFSLQKVIDHYGFDPFDSIEKHIKNNIIPAHDCLTKCHRSNFDEEGYPVIEFYIRYNVNLDFDEWDMLRDDVYDEVYRFCDESCFDDDVQLAFTLIVNIDGAYYE